jgi:hypothetical protein
VGVVSCGSRLVHTPIALNILAGMIILAFWRGGLPSRCNQTDDLTTVSCDQPDEPGVNLTESLKDRLAPVQLAVTRHLLRPSKARAALSKARRFLHHHRPRVT